MSVRVHRLSNGVQVLCDPVPGLETLALSVVANTGARWEPADRSGWSHLLEHMVFKGAGQRNAQQIVEAIEDAGAQINAATGYERTSFQVRALKGCLPLGMEVISDLVFRPILDADELEREKEVVGQEIAEAFDTPDDHVFEMAQAAAFAGQPLGRPILGTVKSIGPARRDTLDAWRRSLYAPSRLAVSVSGAVDEDDLLALAEPWFGAEAAAPAADLAPPAAFTGGAAALSRRIEQANLVWLLPAPGAKDPAWYALRLFAEILGGGMASRLFQEAREKRGLAYNIDAWADAYEDVGLLGVYAGAAADKAEGLGTLVAEILGGLGDGVTDQELARAKAQLKTHLFMAEESPLGRAERAAAQLFVFGRPLTAAEIRADIDAVSLADLKALAQRLTAPGLAATAVLGPKAAGGAGAAFTRKLFGP